MTLVRTDHTADPFPGSHPDGHARRRVVRLTAVGVALRDLTGEYDEQPVWGRGWTVHPWADEINSENPDWRTDARSAARAQRHPVYCGRCGDPLLEPNTEAECDLPGDPGVQFTEVSTDGRTYVFATFEWPCECTGCEIRREGVRREGGQRRFCPKPGCQRARKAASARKRRALHDRNRRTSP